MWVLYLACLNNNLLVNIMKTCIHVFVWYSCHHDIQPTSDPQDALSLKHNTTLVIIGTTLLSFLLHLLTLPSPPIPSQDTSRPCSSPPVSPTTSEMLTGEGCGLAHLAPPLPFPTDCTLFWLLCYQFCCHRLMYWFLCSSGCGHIV